MNLGDVQDEVTAQIVEQFGDLIAEEARRVSPREAVGLIFLDGETLRNRVLMNCSREPGKFRLIREDTMFVLARADDLTAVCLWHSHPTSRDCRPSGSDRNGHPAGVPLMGIVALQQFCSYDLAFWSGPDDGA